MEQQKARRTDPFGCWELPELVHRLQDAAIILRGVGHGELADYLRSRADEMALTLGMEVSDNSPRPVGNRSSLRLAEWAHPEQWLG